MNKLLSLKTPVHNHGKALQENTCRKLQLLAAVALSAPVCENTYLLSITGLL
jgi:hypothetical protein